jgi:hypothetical protein
VNNAEPIAVQRLDDQIQWYATRSQRAQWWFKMLKVVQLVTAGAIPLVSVFAIAAAEKVTAVLGLVILVVEGLQQLNQYHENWISYRATCEGLRHEKFMFEANAGPYANIERPLELLAERTGELILHEHAKWIAAHQEVGSAKRGQ